MIVWSLITSVFYDVPYLSLVTFKQMVLTSTILYKFHDMSKTEHWSHISRENNVLHFSVQHNNPLNSWLSEHWLISWCLRLIADHPAVVGSLYILLFCTGLLIVWSLITSAFIVVPHVPLITWKLLVLKYTQECIIIKELPNANSIPMPTLHRHNLLMREEFVQVPAS